MGVVYFLGTFDHQRPKRTQKRHADIVDIRRAISQSRHVPKKGLTKVLCVNIIETSFRASEKKIFEEYVSNYKKKNKAWRENETFIAMNKSRTMAIFFVGESRINNTVILDTRKWRMIGSGEVWTIDNLVYYAEQVGLDLVIPSIKTVEEVRSEAP
jgi:hypothetical protein